jgi:lysozyme family protein
MMTDLTALKAANAKRWQDANLTQNFALVAGRLIEPAARQRYRSVALKTGVPWWFIAVVHERECSQDWRGSLAQGDPWDRVSVHVPAGRGPFNSWEEAAIDALANCAPFAARNKDWSIGGALTKLEEYNGLGYAARGRPSPYIWSGTDQYVSGKYVRDGVYDPDAFDGQLGCAGLLMAMMALDPTITLTGAVLTPSAGAPPFPKPAAPVAPKPPPSVTNPAKGSIGAAIASLVSAIFSVFRK